MKDLTCQGVWWSPDNPEEQVAGILSFSQQNGTVLELIGSFKEICDVMKLDKLPIVQGMSKEYGGITLVDCQETGSNFGSIITQTYHAKVLYIGAHATSPEDLVFDKAEVCYSNLVEWMNFYPFKINRSCNSNNEPQKLKAWQLTYEYPEDIVIEINQGQIVIGSSLNTEMAMGREYKLEHRVKVAIKLKTPMDLEGWHKQVLYPLQNFFSLATDTPSYIDEIKVYSNQVTMNDLKGGKMLSPIDVRVDFIEGKRKAVLRHEMLFSFHDVRANLVTYLPKWFSAHARLKEAFDQFFGCEYSPFMSLDNRFLSAMNAIESYHRSAFSNDYLSTREHTERLQQIIAATPPCHTKWLQEHLQFSHEPSSRRRLKCLLSVVEASGIIIAESNKVFIESVINTRNYLIHRDEALKEKAATGNELYLLHQKLTVLMKIQLLSELGFTNDQIKSFIERSRNQLTLTVD